MFHWFGVVTNTKGDSLPNWQVECVQLADGVTVVPIYADENLTPILTTSGIADRAKSDSSGNYDFFVPEGTYSLRFYDANGVFQRLQRYLPMYGNAPEAAIDAMEDAQAAQAAAEVAQGLAEDAQAAAEAASELAQTTAGGTVYATWADLAAATGMTAGDSAVVFEDAGTHTDPVVGGTVVNAGIYIYSASPAGWERVADTEAVKAADSAVLSQAWAEGTLPGGAGTKSAKEHAAEAAASATTAQSAFQRYTPFATTSTAANSTGGDATNFDRLRNGVVDVRIFGGSPTETYRVERVRRNASGWGARITRASDNATVAESYYTAAGGFAEPADPTVPQEIYLAPSVSSTIYAIIKVRWSEFAAGVFYSGWTAALAGTCLDRGAPGPANVMTASAARPGHLIMSLNAGEFCTVDETARTFTWPQLYIPDGRANASGRHRIAAGSITFTNNYEVAFIDLDEALAAGVGEAPNTVVKKAVVGRDLVSNGNYAARPNQLPLAWSNHAGRVEVNPTIRLGSTQGTIFEDEMVVRVNPSSNLIQVYQRANGTSTNQRTYIRTELFRDVASERDNWTVRGVFECTRTGYETFTGGQRLQVDGTEMLLAIREQGAADFMGGNAHGDEVITQTPTLLLDGLEIPLTGAATWYHGKTLIFAQDSRYYRVGSALGVALGERTLLLTFENGTMEADTRFQHLTNWTVADCYIAMLAPHRYVTYVDGTSENTGSAQISGKYLDDVRGIPYDISARQGATSPDDTVRVSQPVRRVMMWGTYGVSCEMEVLEASEPILTDLFYINRQSYAYNKGYIGFVGAISGNQAVTSSTVWTWKTRWRWRSKN